ncbi:unnamed protein product [Ilex paraguariensis]|uniref:Triosephosphate isomerase, cytosolic n=1 Tax=Ilex paraguariensis TaxID=185542 RepID=A0ABC8QSA9_9AQUA
MANGTSDEVKKIVSTLNAGEVPSQDVVEVVVSPPFVFLPLVKNLLRPDFHVAAQNCWVKKGGAFTGEISAEMIVNLSIPWVIIGHSERRLLLGESNEFVGDKVAYALDRGLKVIACVGETLEQRESGSTMVVVAAQTKAIAERVPGWSNVVLAYEPVWAIGTGKVATPAQAQECSHSLCPPVRGGPGKIAALVDQAELSSPIKERVPGWSNVVLAYEPVWAIGTGKVATPAQAQESARSCWNGCHCNPPVRGGPGKMASFVDQAELSSLIKVRGGPGKIAALVDQAELSSPIKGWVHSELRKWLQVNTSPEVAATIRIIYGETAGYSVTIMSYIVCDRVHSELRKWLQVNTSPEVAATIRIIYGGSVSGANCKELAAQPDVDGFLVGGASLKPEFIDIIKSAEVPKNA